MRKHADYRVLIIDDDKVDRQVIFRLLKEIKEIAILDQAADVQTARKLLAKNIYDCVVLDYLLPGHTGIDIAREFLDPGRPPFTAFIMLTGEGDEKIAVEAMKSGIHDYLVKERLSAEAIFRAFTNATSAAKMSEHSYYQRQALENFAGLVAHDLMTPLNSVNGFLQLAIAENKETLSARSLDHLETALGSSNYMENLVKGLLNYAQTGSNDEPFDTMPLNEVVKQVTTILDAEIKKIGATIKVEKLPKVAIREYEFIQLFQNLISNSLKYRSDAKPVIKIYACDDEHNHIIALEDNGTGIPEDKVETIFAPLQRNVDNDIPGLGLGLASCAKIIQTHDGRIWCESTPGKGSTFYISVPIKSD